MLTVTVELLHGTYRASSAEDAALAGEASPEWPPSPARLHSALVAGDGTGDRCRVTDGTAGLELLEQAPLILASPLEHVHQTSLNVRFVAGDATAKASHINYPARSGQVVRPGARVAPKTATVTYVWPDAQPTPDQLHNLRLRAARVGYLGCSDSPVRIRIGTEPPEPTPSESCWEPDPGGEVLLPVAAPGSIDHLDAHFAAWSAGQPRRRSWLPTPMMRYRAPAAGAASRPEAPTLWLRFSRPAPGRRVVLVAETLRAATLQHLSAVLGSDDAIPAVVHGHATERGGEHVRWLVLPNAGFDHSDGRLHGACIWFPPGTEPEVVENVRAAVARIRRLVAGRALDVEVELFDGTRSPWSSNPLRWRGPSQRWVSVTPVLHERYTGRGPVPLQQLARWCEFAGLPQPVGGRTAVEPLIHGAVALQPAELGRFGGQRRPYSHVELVFEEAITGPVALGRGRHFGLGLMAPVEASAS